MARENKRMNKTQTLSLRLDPKTKFVIDFLARVRNQSITAVVERAIKEASERESIGADRDGEGGRGWSDFWDANEGVRTLKLIADPEYPTTYDEDELRSFAQAHKDFFYGDPACRSPKRGYLEILWPAIDKYLEIWREEKTEDYWAAGRAMQADLNAADVSAPEWPSSKAELEDVLEGILSKSSAEARPSSTAPTSADLDDEVPF